MIYFHIPFIVVTASLFCFVLAKQIQLYRVYSGDEFTGIRKANILTTFLLILICCIRIYFVSYSISQMHYEVNLTTAGTVFVSLFIFVIAMVNLLYYSGNKFKFLISDK